MCPSLGWIFSHIFSVFVSISINVSRLLHSIWYSYVGFLPLSLNFSSTSQALDYLYLHLLFTELPLFQSQFLICPKHYCPSTPWTLNPCAFNFSIAPESSYISQSSSSHFSQSIVPLKGHPSMFFPF